jgi:hypothetical protein
MWTLEAQMQKALIIIGLACLAAGLLWPLIEKSGLGRLPGDIVVEGERTSFYFPIMTCIVISLVLSAVLWLFNR